MTQCKSIKQALKEAEDAVARKSILEMAKEALKEKKRQQKVDRDEARKARPACVVRVYRGDTIVRQISVERFEDALAEARKQVNKVTDATRVLVWSLGAVLYEHDKRRFG